MALDWNPPPLDDITTLETVTASYLNRLGNSLHYLQLINETKFTGNVPVTGTSDTDIVTSGSITYLAIDQIIIEFYCTRIAVGAAGIHLVKIKDGATVKDRFGGLGQNYNAPVYMRSRIITPGAGSHTYKIAGANVSSQTTTYVAGAGDGDVDASGYIRIYRAVPAS